MKVREREIEKEAEHEFRFVVTVKRFGFRKQVRDEALRRLQLDTKLSFGDLATVKEERIWE